jgi:hypothetical protein
MMGAISLFRLTFQQIEETLDECILAPMLLLFPETPTRFVCGKTIRLSKCFLPGMTCEDATAGSLIEIGDVIAVMKKVLRAKCPALASDAECAQWLTAANTDCTLAAPPDPVSPVVSISAPSVLSQCKSYTLDLTASSGSGGREWTQQVINVSSISQTTASLEYQPQIEEFYRSEYSLSPPTALQSGYLVGNETYVFTVTLCNFLLQCHSSSASMEIINMNAMPVVTIAGSSDRLIRRADAVSLLSSAYVGTCNSTNRFSGMTFQWQVSEDGVVSQQLLSTSNNPFKFGLPGGVLSVGSTYTITVLVKDTLFGGQSYSSVTVEVVPSAVVAVISGGAYQSWRVGEAALTLDGSGSYDLDAGEGVASESLTFTWSCDQSQSPVVLETSFCAQLLPAQQQQSSEATLDMSFMDFSSVLGATFTITLQLEGSHNRSDSTSVSVLVAESSSPKITLLSFPGKINTQTHVQVLTSVEVTATAIGVWSSTDNNMDLAAIATIPSLSTNFPNAGSYLFNLAIGGSSLDAGSTYDFVLYVGGADGSSSSTTAAVTVEVVEPPRSGELAVSPLTGSEFQDFFQFSTSRWTDDELPLSYAFGYFSSSFGAVANMLELQGRGESSFLGDKYLPRGAEARGFNLTCGVYAFNALDARSTRSRSVKVLPVQVSAEDFEASVLSQLTEVSSHQDKSAVKSIVSVGISILNSANCSLAPGDCGEGLHREGCGNTPHTCGPCLEGYLGESLGDGNSACYPITADSSDTSGQVSGACVNSTDCPAMQSCKEGLCAYTAKACASDCSGRGRCQLELKTSGVEVEECLMNDFTCLARCVCDEGFLGTGCSETASAMQAKQHTRHQLIYYLNSTMQFEDTDSDSLTAQIALVMDLGANPSELIEASCVILQSIVETIFSAAADVEIPVSTLQGLLGVLDNCDQVYIDSFAGDNARLASGSASDAATASLNNNKLLRTSFNGLASKSMVAGETDKEFIDAHSRSTISKNAAGDASEQAVPQSQLEQFFQQPKSSLRISGLLDADSTAGGFTRSVVLEETEPSLHTNNSEFTSNPLKVEYVLSSTTAQDVLSDASNQSVSVVFQNNGPQAYITNSSNSTSSSGVKFVTDCATSSNVTTSLSVNYTCPDGQVVSHRCTDSSEIITSECPALRYLPVCRTLSSSSDEEEDTTSTCTLVSFTSTNVTCNCTILLQQSSSGTGDGRRHLYGSSTVESSGYIEMVSMSEYTYEGFVSTNSEITEISISDIQNGLIVIIMFSSLWGCGAIGLYELMKSWYCKCAAEVDPDNTPKEREKTISTKDISLDTKKEYLVKYIDNILPTVFRSSMKHDSTLQSLWKTIRTYHPYAVVFTAEGPGAKEMKIQKGIHLLTIQAMLMFIMAVFCDLQVHNAQSYIIMQHELFFLRNVCI